jgi:hypothetical protein
VSVFATAVLDDGADVGPVLAAFVDRTVPPEARLLGPPPHPVTSAAAASAESAHLLVSPLILFAGVSAESRAVTYLDDPIP